MILYKIRKLLGKLLFNGRYQIVRRSDKNARLYTKIIKTRKKLAQKHF